MGNTDKCLALAKAAPKLTQQELEEMNALFPAYIFRRRKTREVWTTCCGSHGVLPATSQIMEAMHTPEPKRYGFMCYHRGMYYNPPKEKQPEPMACPFCGKVSPVKELGRTGKRDNLWASRRAVVLRWYRGALWATAYNLVKSYGNEAWLTDRPTYSIQAIYRFKSGQADKVGKYSWLDQWAGSSQVKGNTLKPGFSFSEPYAFNHEDGMGYHIINMSELDKSPFRYCGAEAFTKKSSSLMRYLALCTIYPRQVEMLTKAGLVSMVVDFVDHKKSNATIFNWNEADPLKSFGLNKVEMKEFLAVRNKEPKVLRRFKQLRRHKIVCGVRELYDFKDQVAGYHFDRVASLMVKHRLTPAKLRRYLEKERAGDGGLLSTGAGWWLDYIDAAEYLGYDLTNPIFLLPKDLKEHHDRATKAATAVRNAKRKEENRKKEADRCRKLAKRYTYTDGSLLIRPPLGTSEIVAEGKALKHCVGGYADRHVNGHTTILFLRDRNRPGRPLVTIEMDGNKIRQIHGWDDERTACKDNPHREDPRKLYADFLEPWLAWIEGGSRRDKKGHPILKAKKKAGAA